MQVTKAWSIANDISLWHHRSKDRHMLSAAFDRSVDSIMDRLSELKNPHHVSFIRLACNLKHDEDFIQYMRNLERVIDHTKSINHDNVDYGGDGGGIGGGGGANNNLKLYRIVMNEKRYIPTLEQLIISQRCLQYSAVAGLKLRVVARAGTGKSSSSFIELSDIN